MSLDCGRNPFLKVPSRVKENGISCGMLMSLLCPKDSIQHFRQGHGAKSIKIAFAEAAAFGVPAVRSRSGGVPDAGG